MDFDMKELEAFVAVVENGSFSKAAQTLFLTQPTISAHVASLERKLEIKLLVRTTKEIYLSDAGKLLYEYAREILRLRVDAVQAVKCFAQEIKGTVEIVASTIPGQYFLPKLIQSFRTTYPDVCFHVELMDSTEVAERVAGRRAEIGFVGTVIDISKCVYQEIGEDELVIITPNTPKYQAYRGGTFPLQQLAKEVLVAREVGSGTRMETESFLRTKGIEPEELQIAVEVRSTESIKQMVSEGLGISVISRKACEDYCQFQKLLAFHFGSASLRRKLYMVHYKNGVLSPAAQAFYHYAASFFRSNQ